MLVEPELMADPRNLAILSHKSGFSDDHEGSPEKTSNLNGTPSTQDVGQIPGDQGPKPRSTRHSRRDTSLSRGIWSNTLAFLVERRLIEVAFVGLAGDTATS